MVSSRSSYSSSVSRPFSAAYGRWSFGCRSLAFWSMLYSTSVIWFSSSFNYTMAICRSA